MIQNFRDVGETVNILFGKEIMPEKMLYRGGSINQLFDESELPPVRAILNIRTGADKIFSTVRAIHVPAVNSVENYNTANGKVKNWANKAIKSIAAIEAYPLLIHCTAGKDRTGVLVALLLSCIGVEKEIIIEEYLQSEGIENSNDIEAALLGIANPLAYIHDCSAVEFLKTQLRK